MTTLEQVREELLDARRAGISFDAAWQRARASPSREWRAALDATASAWRSAYEGERVKLPFIRYDDSEPVPAYRVAASA